MLKIFAFLVQCSLQAKHYIFVWIWLHYIMQTFLMNQLIFILLVLVPIIINTIKIKIYRQELVLIIVCVYFDIIMQYWVTCSAFICQTQLLFYINYYYTYITIPVKAREPIYSQYLFLRLGNGSVVKLKLKVRNMKLVGGSFLLIPFSSHRRNLVSLE